MGVPERLGVGRALDQIGGAAGKLVAGERPMPEHIAQAVAKLIAHFGDALVGRAAMGTGIAAIFNQRDGRVRRPEHVVARLVDRTRSADCSALPAPRAHLALASIEPFCTTFIAAKAATNIMVNRPVMAAVS